MAENETRGQATDKPSVSVTVTAPVLGARSKPKDYRR